MGIKILSLSKNEDFKKILSGRKINNYYSTIFYKKISSEQHNILSLSIVVKKKLGKAVQRSHFGLPSGAFQGSHTVGPHLVALGYFGPVWDYRGRMEEPCLMLVSCPKVFLRSKSSTNFLFEVDILLGRSRLKHVLAKFQSQRRLF